jgi:formylglycine-generating enzyme required for sulfatase activity
MVDWTTDKSMEVFGYATVEQLKKAYSDATKNMTAQLKIIEFWGDMGLGLAGIFYEGSGYYDMNLDFNDIPINTRKFTVGDVTFSMVEVKGGSFLMGASMEQINAAHDNEYPLHNVTLNDYYIGQTEVTQELWQAVMGSVPGSFKNSKYPVSGVSWLECQQFITKLNEMTGEHFRLPTEAEWEYAARGGSGSMSRLYSGSDNLDNVAWYSGNSRSMPHVVATKYPNQLALYDMSGNAMEWCSDWYGSYSSDALTNPTGPAEGTQRVCRGGGWGYGSDLCRVSCRNSFAPGNSINENLGLRLVWEPGNSHDGEYVDLGLPSGTLWATCNVGASAPEQYGDYFAWGETAPKDYYDLSTYKWCNGSYVTLTKYCTDSSYGYNGFTDGKTELDPEDDAAYVNWGPQWRMPSMEQQRELVEQCTCTWTSRNGVNGHLFTGPNGNTFFLPAAGYRRRESLYGVGSYGGYWSRTLSSSYPGDAYYLDFYSGYVGWRSDDRSIGFTVRAVRVSQN